MRPGSRTHLARQLAAEIQDAWCEGQGVRWSRWEATHAAARTAAAATAAAAPAMAMCRRCAEVDRCEQLMQLGDYTGLAAGGAWLNGHLRPVSAVMPHTDQHPAQQAG